MDTKPVNGVSIIVPAYNNGQTLRDCLESATALDWANELEVIVVNDGSTDNTAEIASLFSGVRLIHIPHGGAARATNIGIKAASYNIVVLLDADAILEKDWLEKIMPSLSDKNVAAVAGYAMTANSSIIGKIMGYDIESRLNRVPLNVDHIYTMNTAYKRSVLMQVGLLNEDMKVGYDVDLSRRIKYAGYSLILRKEVKCRHYWRDTLWGFIRQQYDYAYWRMELIRRFIKPYNNITGLGMILQVPFTTTLLSACFLGIFSPKALLAILLLPIIHLPKAFSLLICKRDSCALLLPLLFRIRNLCWVLAAMVWGIRYITLTLFPWRRLLSEKSKSSKPRQTQLGELSSKSKP